MLITPSAARTVAEGVFLLLFETKLHEMWNIAKKHDILSSKFAITAGGIECGIYGYSNCQILSILGVASRLLAL